MRQQAPPEERDALVRLSRTLFYGGWLLAPITLWRATSVGTVSDLAFAASAFLLAISPTKPKGAGGTRVSWHVAGAFIVIGGLIATYQAVSVSNSVATVLRLAFLVFVLPWQLSRLLNTARRQRTGITLFIVGAAASGIAGVLQVGFHLHISGGQYVLGRSAGLTQNVNDQGGELACAGVLAAGLRLYWRSALADVQRRGRLLRRLLEVTLLACIGGLIASGSVTGMFAFVAGMAFILLRSGFNLRPWLLAVGVAAVGYFGVAHLQHSSGALNPFQRLAQTTGSSNIAENDTLHARLLTDQIALHHIANDPLVGSGLDTASGITYADNQTHNMILLVWWQGGLLVLLGLLIVLVDAARLVRRRTVAPLNKVLLPAFVAELVFAMTAPILYQRYFWLPLLFAVGVWSSSLLAVPFPDRADAEQGTYGAERRPVHQARSYAYPNRA